MFDILASDDPRIMVVMSVPVPGRKQPMVIKLPRFDFIDESQHAAIDEAFKSVDSEHADWPIRRRRHLANLKIIKPFMTAKDYAACEKLTVGQLDMIIERWAEQSNVSLGEFLASAESSMENTEAPSSLTSMPEDGQEGTSDAA
jgi:hypothetical protein